LPGTDPIHKVTIIPRGRALGVTQQLPIDEKHNYPREYLINEIAIMMGGRVAEELVLDSITTGAGNDIERATELARKMVCEWGMSDRLGPLTFGHREEMIFLGREIAQHQDYSEQTAVEIDQEVRRLVMENYERAKGIITSRIQTLHTLASALLEREVLDGAEIEEILKGTPEKAAAPSSGEGQVIKLEPIPQHG
jgi:cell division protease FtsH